MTNDQLEPLSLLAVMGWLANSADRDYAGRVALYILSLHDHNKRLIDGQKMMNWLESICIEMSRDKYSGLVSSLAEILKEKIERGDFSAKIEEKADTKPPRDMFGNPDFTVNGGTGENDNK